MSIKVVNRKHQVWGRGGTDVIENRLRSLWGGERGLVDSRVYHPSLALQGAWVLEKNRRCDGKARAEKFLDYPICLKERGGGREKEG